MTPEPSLHGKTLSQWKAELADHKAKRPSNLEVEKIRRHALRTESIQNAIDILENSQRGSWRAVEHAQ
nr:hypothetical protein [uncultured Holophaga sp.]